MEEDAGSSPASGVIFKLYLFYYIIKILFYFILFLHIIIIIIIIIIYNIKKTKTTIFACSRYISITRLVVQLVYLSAMYLMA